MEYAIDKRTGQEIDASIVRDKLGRHFICPVCRKTVYHSHGPQVSPHFKHEKGVGTTDCENYHPGTGHDEKFETFSHFKPETSIRATKDGENCRTGTYYHQPSYSFPVRPTQSSSPPKINQVDYSFDLNIQLSNPLSKTPTWHLILTFTPHPNQNDYLLVKQGMTGPAKVPLSQSVAISVKIPESDYQLEIDYDNVELKRVSKTLPGLTRYIANVFKHQGDHGSRLENSKPLLWGEQYFIIWHETLGMNFSPEIKRRELTTQQNYWKGVEILLPNSPDNAIIVWVTRYLRRTIQAPLPMLSLVTPFLYRSNTNTIPQIKDTDEIVIAILDPLGNHINGTLVIEHKTSNKTSKLERRKFTDASSPVIIELGRLALGETTIRLENAQSSWLVVNCVPPFKPVFPQAVRLKFKNHGEVLAYNGMRQELQGDSLISVEFPTPIKFNILTRRQSELEWQLATISIHPGESLKDFENRAMQAILEQLNNQDLFIKLDFGNFGQLLIQQPAHIAVKSDLALPRQVTQQLNWLTGLAQGGSLVSGEGLRMFKHLSRHHGELNHYFQHTQGIPATVEPHLRILVRRITKMWG